MPKLKQEDVVSRLKDLYGDLISLAPNQEYRGIWEPMRFVDKDFGEWTDIPNKILNKGKVHPERGKLNRKKVNLERYGAENPFQSEKIKEKIKATNQEKYGVDYPSQNEEIQKKARATSMKNFGSETFLTSETGKAVVQQRMQERFGVDRPAQNPEILEKMKATYRAKYGHENPMQNVEIKAKATKTLQERYGVETSPAQNKDVRKKTVATNREKYGSDAPMQNKEVQTKAQNTIQQHYGVDNIFQNEDIKQKITQTLVEKYGVEHPAHHQDIRNKMAATCRERYGAASPLESQRIREQIYTTYKEQHPEMLLPNGLTITEYLQKHERDLEYTSCKYVFLKFGFDTLREYVENGKNFGRISSLELWASTLFGLPTHDNYISIKQKPDFILNATTYIDVDGLYFHSNYIMKNKKYHFDKRLSYERAGFRLLQFREDEIFNKPQIVKSMIQNIQGLNQKRYARQCTLRDVPWKEAKDFLNENHLQGAGSPARCLGLYHQEILLQLIGIKTKASSLEILRLCTRNNWSLVGGFSKLLTEVIRRWSPTEIISWCDLRYADGHGYEKMGFRATKDVLGWSWTDFKKTFNRRKCRAGMDARKLTEAEHAKELGWHKIYDSGQRLYKLLIGNTC